MQSGAPFLMEVADRRPEDRKGGHLGRYRSSGRWMLRELAHCPPNELADFQDIERFRYFNTNNIWWHLPSLWQVLESLHGLPQLPLILNRKLLDPLQPVSPPVYQLETAIGSAIEIFDQAAVVRVPRSRQIAIKHWSDLITIWSDAYVETPDGRIVLHPERQGIAPVVQLDPRYYNSPERIRQFFPAGIPSLLRCDSLTVTGPVVFDATLPAEGDVALTGSASHP